MRSRGVTVSPVLWIAAIVLTVLPCSGQIVEGAFNVGAQPCAVALNVFNNQIIEANCLGDTVGVISGINNSVTSITVGSRPVALAVNPRSRKIYVANSASDTVSVIDSNTLMVTTVSVGANPRSLAVNEVTNQIYVANNGDGTVTVIDGATNKTLTLKTATNPIAVAINPVTNQIYVSNSSGTVTIINGNTNQQSVVPVGVFPQSLAINPITNQIYVANSDSNTVTVIDGTTRQTTALNVGLFPVAIAINPVTNQIYVADSYSLDVAVIDGITLSTIKVSLGDNPNALAVDVSSNLIYIASASGIVTVLDGATNQITTTVPVGLNPSAVAVNPVTNRVFTADSNSNTITAIDADTDQTTTVGLGANPLAVDTNPVTNLTYAANADDNTVSVIDGVTGQTTTLSVGTEPSALAVNPLSNQIYVTNSLSNAVTVIDGVTNATSTVSVGVNPTAVAVNPVTNWAYVANTGDATITAIEGTTGQIMTLSVGTTPCAIAVNFATDTIYVANRADNTATAINGLTGRTVTIGVGVNPSAIAVDSVTNQIYVANSGSNNVSVIDGATNVVTTVAVGGAPVAVAVNSTTNQIYVANSSSGTVTVIAGGTNQTATVTVGSNPIALKVNPATGHIYVANFGSNTITVIDGRSNQTTTVATGTNPTSLSINPLTGQIYVTNSGSSSGSVIMEQRFEVLPLTTVTSALSDNETVERSPTFILSGISSYAPFNPPVLGVRYQIDSWDGLWQAATASGTDFNAITSPLQLGPHVIYAYADNGQASADTGLDGNVVSGITGYFFTVVQGQTATTVTSSSNPSADGQSVILTASVQAVAPARGVPAGAVSFFDGATILASGVALNNIGQASFTTSSLGPATHSITASYAGNTNFTSSTSTVFTQEVAKGQTTATLASSLNPSPDGQPVTLTASVQAVAPATGTPTGTVTFLDGATILASGVALNGSGQAGVTKSSLAPGTNSITASYTGDTTFASSTSTTLSQVVAKGQTQAMLSCSLNPSTFEQGVTLTITMQAVAPATGIPTGTVTVLDGTTILAAGLTLNGTGQASFVTSSLAPGTHAITATYGGDANFTSSTSSTLSQVVGKGQTTLTLTSSLNPSPDGQPVILTASVQAVTPATGIPSGTVTFLDGTTILAAGLTLNGTGQANFVTSFLAPGTHAITATYGGDTNFTSSVSSAISDTVNPPQISLTLSATSLTVPQGGTGSFGINVSSSGTLPSLVSFSCAGLPANTVCLFSPSSLNASALPGKVTVNISTDTIAEVSRPRKGLGQFWYGLTVVGIVFAGLERASRRTKIVLGAAVLLLLLVLGVSCGSPSKIGSTTNTALTPVGVSTIRITASSGSLQVTANLALTVVQ